MNIVFMGTPEYAVPSLKALHDRHRILAVYTQPDRPSGRGHKLLAPAAKLAAQELQLEVRQPLNFRNPIEISALRDLAPDLIVVIAYGILLPQSILDIPRYGCLNAHGSILPEFRGASPIQEAILQGYDQTGVTIICMDAGMDSGDIVLCETLHITGLDFNTASRQLAELSAKLLLQAIDQLEEGTLKRTVQNHAHATYTRKITKGDGWIDFNDTARNIYQRFLALQGWPGLFTHLNGKPLKILDLEMDPHTGGAPGSVTEISPRGIKVATTEGSVVLKRIQLPGKKALDVAQFLLGHKLEKGSKLGI